MFDHREKVALFIDGYQLYATSRAIGIDIDYSKLREYFSSKAYLVRACYYTAQFEDTEYSASRPLIDWLEYNGYKISRKAAKEYVDASGRRKVKGNIDLELAIDAIDLCQTVDHFVLFSGDGDFRILIEALQRRGKKVTVVSTCVSSPPMISDELRRAADNFLDLSSIKEEVGREIRRHSHDDNGGINRTLYGN